MSDVEGEAQNLDETSTPTDITKGNQEDAKTTSRSQNSAATTSQSQLSRDMIRFGLSRIARTLDTFEFAYSRFDCRRKNLSNIDLLSKYIHLRIIDLGENQLKSCQAIASVQNLLLLNLESNVFESMTEIPDFPFLQALCLRNNKLKSSDGLFPNRMTYLQLGDNYIEDVHGLTSDVFPALAVLELKGNSVKSLAGIDLPHLKRIYLAQNELKDLQGLSGCPNLTHLHARNNKIEQLNEFPGLEKLEYVNLRGNNLRQVTQLPFLGNAPNIKTIVLKENPVASSSNYKLEILVANQSLRRLDKNPVLETDMMEARQIRNDRKQGIRSSLHDDEEPTNFDHTMSTEKTGESPLHPNNDEWFDAGHEN